MVATPTSPTPAFKIGAKREPLEEYLADVYTIGANLAGLPGMSVASGFTDDGLPLGLQLLGPQQADVQVVRIGDAFEQATRYVGGEWAIRSDYFIRAKSLIDSLDAREKEEG